VLALVFTFNVAVRTPTAVGVKLTEYVQDTFTAREAPQVVENP
jgi:hypothetical protein